MFAKTHHDRIASRCTKSYASYAPMSIDVLDSTLAQHLALGGYVSGVRLKNVPQECANASCKIN